MVHWNQSLQIKALNEKKVYQTSLEGANYCSVLGSSHVIYKNTRTHLLQNWRPYEKDDINVIMKG